VIILGDSHLKGCAVKLRSELSAKFKVSGMIRPGAGSEKIVNSSVEDSHLQDVIVLNTGANDVYKNATGLALSQITKFIQRNYGANIIIIDIPLRYDLSPSSCINLEIEEFNRKLQEIITLYNHVTLLETKFKRECFTRQGLHWNSLGKSSVVKLLLHQIIKLTNKGFQTPINLPWRDEALVDITNSCNKGMSTLVGTVNANANLSNVNIKDCEQRNHELATQIVETNLRKTSTRQI
jgi:hypothetical protein